MRGSRWPLWPPTRLVPARQSAPLCCSTLWTADGPACPACSLLRIVAHPEIETLAIAHVGCDAFYASVVIAHDMAKYRAASAPLREIMRAAAEVLEPVSLDEASLDLAGRLAEERSPAALPSTIECCPPVAAGLLLAPELPGPDQIRRLLAYKPANKNKQRLIHIKAKHFR